MGILFEPARLKNVTLRNRFVRSATYDGMSDAAGLVTDRQVQLISDLAAGGVGMIISAIMYCQNQKTAAPGRVRDCRRSFLSRTLSGNNAGGN